MPIKKTILVAPLHWGLGHAARCIPIIQALLEQKFNVLLASDGAALLFLQKEFPQLESIELPSYNISYSKNIFFFKLKILLQLPKIRKAIAGENRIVKALASEDKIQGIISDNRFGVRSDKIPSVFITHQLNVFSGNTSLFSSKIHQRIIRNFDVCWVPDTEEPGRNLSGKLGHVKTLNLPVKYIGILSRMKKLELPETIDILVLISGPEPQRTAFEEMLKPLFKDSSKRIVIIRGVVEETQTWNSFGNIEIVNYMTGSELEKTLNISKLVLCRPGYTSIMDLTVLEKKVFFIPTPGQYEQEYLAEHLKQLKLVPFSKQDDFKLENLDKIYAYKGLSSISFSQVDYSHLFTLFQSE